MLFHGEGGKEDGSYIWEDRCGNGAAKQQKQPLPSLLHPVCLRRREAGGLGGVRGLLGLHVLTQSEPDYTFTAEGRGHA